MVSVMPPKPGAHSCRSRSEMAARLSIENINAIFEVELVNAR